MAVALVKRVFQKHPFVSNCVVYGTLYVGAEFSQQTLSRKILSKKEPPEPYDIGSLARYAVVGSTVYPIMLHNCNGNPRPYDMKAMARYGLLGLCFYPQVYYFWYKWLDKHYAGTAAKTVVKKLLLDQFLFTPPLIIAFYLSMSIMERKENVFEECTNKLIPTFKSSCLFWLPAQTINFLLVPPPARVVYVGSCALIWVNILCWYKRQDY